MTLKDNRTSRRSFFLKGSAALGAGVAATAGAAMLPGKPERDGVEALSRQLAEAADREAIRQLHMAFTGVVEARGYEAAAALFEARASVDLGNTDVIHSAYRSNALQRHDTLQFMDEGRQATALWHVDVAAGTGLKGDSTAAQMARLQGNLADRRWESGRIEARYSKSQGKWKIAALRYTAA